MSDKEMERSQSHPSGAPNSAANDLIAKLEAATEGCRDLDLAFAQTVGANWSYTGEPPRVIYCKPYTTSLDAIVALIERKLPDWWVQYLGQDLRGWSTRIERQGVSLGLFTAPTPALALCIALLRALSAQQGEG